MRITRWISIIVIMALMIGATQNAYGSKYKKGGQGQRVKIGKNVFVAKEANGKYNILKKSGRTCKTIIEGITFDSFVTNGKYVYYTDGKGKDYYGDRVNRIYCYSLKSGKTKLVIKAKEYSVANPEVKKGKRLYFRIYNPVDSIEKYCILSLKNHKKKTIVKFKGVWNTKFIIRGKRIIISKKSFRPGATTHRYIYKLSGVRVKNKH